MTNNDISAKVGAAGAGGAVATIAIWVLSTFGITVEPNVAAALATLLAFVGGYIARDRSRDVGTGNVPDPAPSEPPAA